MLNVKKSGFEGGVDQIHHNFTVLEKNHNLAKKGWWFTLRGTRKKLEGSLQLIANTP